MKFVWSFLLKSFGAFSLIELLIALSVVSFSFIFFTKVLLQQDSSSNVQSLKIPICDTIQKHCVYHVSTNKPLPLINIP